MQFFYLKKGSNLPALRLELIDDGRGTYNHFNEAIQNADIRFTMTNRDTNIVKIAKAPCVIRLREQDTCDEEYVICYEWKNRDTNESGTFDGVFEIDFNGGLSGDGANYPSGKLNMPIREALTIVIED